MITLGKVTNEDMVGGCGFSVASTDLTPAQTAILVGLMVAAPAMLVLPMAIGLPLILFALILRCALTEGCMAQFGDMQGFFYQPSN